jgi:hypothetical protein
VLLLFIALPVLAGGEEPYPEFTARYDVHVNGIKVGFANFSLQHLQADEYLYHSEAGTTGMARLLGADTSTESSRWRYTDNRIQVIEYKAQREKGDDDDNAHLVFDWQRMRVANRGAGEHWEIPMPPGTLDSMVMQLAMLFDLRDGMRVLKYPVAVRGRIKRYHFEVAGSETTTLPFGSYDTVKLARIDDSRDRSWVWSAPELDYFPVRFVKQKGSGVKTEILLRELDFKPAMNNAIATP